MATMKANIEYLGYEVAVSYPWAPSGDQAPMGRLVCAGCEYGALSGQHPILIEKLRNDLAKIPQGELSCRKVLDATYKSEIFDVFKNISKHFDPKYRNESFARNMAHDASKLTDIPYITESEAHMYLFCMLSCIGFIDMEAKISDVDKEALPDELKFICIHPHRARPGQTIYREITVTNFGDPENRKVTSRFVKSPTFKPAEANVFSGKRSR
jgi:hypothetical protein